MKPLLMREEEVAVPVTRMAIYVENANGSVKSVAVNTTTETIASLKEKIDNAFKIPVFQQRLVFNGSHLSDDDKLLADYGVQRFATVKVIRTLRDWSS
jgi:hypothetical protein